MILFVLLLNRVFDITTWHFALIIKYRNHWTASRCFSKRLAVQSLQIWHQFSLACQALAPIATVIPHDPSPSRAIALHNCRQGTPGAVGGVSPRCVSG